MNYRIIAVLLLIILGLSLTTIVQNRRINGIKNSLAVVTNNLKSEQTQTKFWKDKDSLNHSLSIQQDLTISNLKNSENENQKRILLLTEKYNIALKKLSDYASITNNFKSDTIIEIPDTSLLKCHDLSNKNVGNLVCISKTKSGYELSSIIDIDNTIDIFFIDKKQTINSPKKFFIFRWFQKKYTETTVEVVNTNPLIKTKKQYFTHIIK